MCYNWLLEALFCLKADAFTSTTLNNLLFTYNAISFLPAQLLWAPTIVGIQCSVEEIAQVIDDRACDAQLGEGTGACAS